MASPTKTLQPASSSFYNLQTKRTLPREVIKWMQGLDLSYSVKDYRKDMSNGFLLAQIISRYQPGKIPMHAFENTQNTGRRNNNWNQLNLFFKKHTLRDIQIAGEDYSNVMHSKDPKSQQLYQLICRMYTICTKRTISENAPVIDAPPTQTNNPNLTASYLLRQDGLEKLQNSGVMGSGIDGSRADDKSQQRMPTRKIAPNSDPNSNMVDVMGIGIRPDNRKMTSKRKSWQAQQQSNYTQDNIDNQKMIFDYLNDIIEECIDPKDFVTRDLLTPEQPKYLPNESLRKALPNVQKQFYCNFLHQITVNVQQLVPIILRQLNEIWKFFNYFVKMVRHYSPQSQQFGLLLELLRTYALACYNKEARRTQRVFQESIIILLVGEVRASKEWKKREKLMQLVYDFQGRDLNQKKIVLNKLKQSIGSQLWLYMQWLSVLVREETQTKSNLGNRLLQDYIYYAHQHLTSANTSLRTSSLKILYEISKTQSIQIIQPFFYAKATNFQNSKSDPQHIMLLILIYTHLLHELIQSKDYQNLIKGNTANTLVKVYNPDHQKNLEQLKKKNQLLGETVYRLFNCTSDVTVRQICARLSVPLIQQSTFMMQIFLQFINLVTEKEEFLTAQETYYELKSTRIQCDKIDVSIIEEYSNEILVQVIGNILKQGAPIEGYMFLINHCLSKINIKKINMQIWQDISLHVVKPFTHLITDHKYSKLAFQGIKAICHIYFAYDMKIRELTTWLAAGISKIIQAKNNECRMQVSAFNQYLNEEYGKNKQQSIKALGEQLAQLLNNYGVREVIVIVNI